MGPCGPIDSPLAVTVLQGRYSISNISLAPQINYDHMCTTVLGNVVTYNFDPMSSNVSIVCTSGPRPCAEKSLGWTAAIEGFWGNSGFASFSDGAYTVVAADEWGHVQVATFDVRG